MEMVNSSGHQDVIIVGAGVAGSALAYALGKDGRRVLVIERDLTEPNRMAGEVLQPGGYLKLLELGLEDCVTDIDSQLVMGYVLYKDSRTVRLPFPLKNSDPDHVTGRSFHHGRFVQRIRKKAASLSNIKLEQGTVTSLLKENGTVKGVHYKTKIGLQMMAYASLTVICDGCFSNLRRSLYNIKVDKLSYFAGWIMENCRLPNPNHGHVILADAAPILFYPISTTETRCLVEIPSQNLPSISTGKLSHYLKTRVAQQIPPELQTVFISSISKENIKAIPNWSMSTVPRFPAGAFLIGDALNMRHPLTGGGMTVALSDVVILRDLLRPLPDLNDASKVCNYLQSFYSLRKPMAVTINTLAALLHRFFDSQGSLARMKVLEACFDYLSLGIVFPSEFIALLAGINPSRIRMLLLLSNVASYSIVRLLLPFLSAKRTSSLIKWVDRFWCLVLCFLRFVNHLMTRLECFSKFL